MASLHFVFGLRVDLRQLTTLCQDAEYLAYPFFRIKVNRRLRMYANRKLRSSKLFERSGPSYTPYHMMAESRPLNLLLRLSNTPLWR